MALKLSAQEKKQRSELIAQLQEKEEALRTALANLNDLHEEVREFKEALVDRLREEFDEKSDAWRDGERGAAVDEWVNSWDELETDEVSDLDSSPLSEALEALEDQPSSF